MSPVPLRCFLAAVVLPVLAGCLPGSGPASHTIVNQARPGWGATSNYALIPLDAAMADYVSAGRMPNLAATFGAGAPPPAITIGVGDIVVVTIFEAASGGLFSGEPGALNGSKSVSLPPQPVAQNGTIEVPYVGRVQVAGRTSAAVADSIEQALQNQAIQPQVIVSVTEGASTDITVAGEVGSPGPVPLTLNGRRILDAIAAAGGSRAPDYESFVRLTRGGVTASTSLAGLVRDPGQNVYLRPSDLLYVSVDPQIFTAFGATARNATYPFETDRLTLAEAVGRAGGLLDDRANPRGVFVFRYEDPGVYMPVAGGHPAPATAAGVPVAYQLDLQDPNGYFAAQRFLMRDNDVLYVSSAPATDLQKALGIISPTLSTTAATTRLASDLVD